MKTVYGLAVHSAKRQKEDEDEDPVIYNEDPDELFEMFELVNPDDVSCRVKGTAVPKILFEVHVDDMEGTIKYVYRDSDGEIMVRDDEPEGHDYIFLGITSKKATYEEDMDDTGTKTRPVMNEPLVMQWLCLAEVIKSRGDEEMYDKFVEFVHP